MLLVQTADDLLYVPDRDIASIMPTYPDRWRIVLQDGRVGHRTGPAPQGPWVPLQNGWVRPEHLKKEDNHWVDPAGFRYPYQPLDIPEEEEPASDLPPGLLTVERRDKTWFWCTDSGELPCEGPPQPHPDLAQLTPHQLVYLPRVRRLYTTPPGPCAALELDNGRQLKVLGGLYFRLANRLGLESFVSLDLSVPETMWKLRDFPYDLTSADPDKILKDLPTELAFLQNLLWQVATQNRTNDYDKAGFAQHPMLSSARRCGYHPTKGRIYMLLHQLTVEQELFTLRQLGFREISPERRLTGSRHPNVVLLAPHPELQAARKAAREHGISLLITGNSGAITQEYLAAELSGPIQILRYNVPDNEIKTLRKRFAQLGLPSGPPILVQNLQNIPSHQPTALTPQPFSRIPLQDFTGLYYADPQEIAAWTPTRPEGYRVDLHNGRILHHPQSPVDPRLQLKKHQWHLDDGTQQKTGLDFLDAAAQHPSLAGRTKDHRFNYNRLRSSDPLHLHLDDGTALPVPQRLWRHKLQTILGIDNLAELSPDPHCRRYLQLRDLPYEIVRAKADKLQADFPDWTQLIANIVWQVYCERYQYADTFQGFFYRPLQAAPATSPAPNSEAPARPKTDSTLATAPCSPAWSATTASSTITRSASSTPFRPAASWATAIPSASCWWKKATCWKNTLCNSKKNSASPPSSSKAAPRCWPPNTSAKPCAKSIKALWKSTTTATLTMPAGISDPPLSSSCSSTASSASEWNDWFSHRSSPPKSKCSTPAPWMPKPPT